MLQSFSPKSFSSNCRSYALSEAPYHSAHSAYSLSPNDWTNCVSREFPICPAKQLFLYLCRPFLLKRENRIESIFLRL